MIKPEISHFLLSASTDIKNFRPCFRPVFKTKLVMLTDIFDDTMVIFFPKQVIENELVGKRVTLRKKWREVVGIHFWIDFRGGLYL